MKADHKSAKKAATKAVRKNGSSSEISVLKSRPLYEVLIGEGRDSGAKDRMKLPFEIPAKVKKQYHGVRFFVRKSITAHDSKSASHGDLYILRKMLKDRPYEAAHRRALAKVSKAASCQVPSICSGPWSGRTVLDLGANIGAFAVQAACQGARVLAIEPDSETFAVLEKNATINAKNGKYERGALQCLKGAVSHIKADPGSSAPSFFLYGKSASSYRPHKPNRHSLLQDTSGSNTHRLEKVDTMLTLVESMVLARRKCRRPSLDVVKMDIEGSEKEMIGELTCAELLRGIGSKASAQNFQLMVYYHLDKWPLLKQFDKFLCKLEGLFKQVNVEWTPMAPDPAKPDNGLWSDWRNRVRNPRAVSYTPDLCARTEGIGMASAKKDVLIYCKGVRL